MNFCFSVRLFVGSAWSFVFSSPPQQPNNSNFEGFSIPDFIHDIYFPIFNSWERASIFPFECLVPNKGTTGTIFITSLVWGGPWLGIEPRPPALKSQHYTTKLLRRWWTEFITFILIWTLSETHSGTVYKVPLRMFGRYILL